MSAHTQLQIVSPEFLEELITLTIQGPTLEIARIALRLQTEISSYEFIVNHVLENKAFMSPPSPVEQ